MILDRSRKEPFFSRDLGVLCIFNGRIIIIRKSNIAIFTQLNKLANHGLINKEELKSLSIIDKLLQPQLSIYNSMIKKIVWNLHQAVCNSKLKISSSTNYFTSNLITNRTNSNIQQVPQGKGQIQTKERSSKLKTISNEGKRIQLEIMTKIEAPNFISENIETLNFAHNIKSFNIHLTNGGDEYQEFPLIKLLSIALKKVEEGDGEITSWKKLEYYIRKRLHRCTIEENLKLLYIMLKIFPKYTFDYGFILSICLALKKQIDIMSIDELKSLYYVLYTNSNQQKRYKNQILSNIQSIILSKMLERYRDKLRSQQTKKHTHLPLSNIYSWITLGLSLNLRIDYEQIVYQNKIVELIDHFNQRWEAAFAKQQYNRSISDKEMSSLFVLFCMNDNFVKYYEVGMKKSIRGENGILDFKQIFNAFKLNFLVANSRSVQRMLKNCSYIQGLKAFRSILQIYQFQIIQNLLEEPEETANSGTELMIAFPKIRNTLQFYMKNSQNCQRIIYEKLKILNLLFNKSVISLFELQTFYSSIDLSTQVNYSLDICNQLLLTELFIYSSDKKDYLPRNSVLRYIFGFLESHNFTYRNFDWNSFHFISLVLQNQNEVNQKHFIGSNLPKIEEQKNIKSQISLRASKILRKISEQVKICNNQKLVIQQKQILQKKKQIREIQKFFIQIRVNEMQKLQTIIAPFNRLPHFSNIKEKIAINALSEKELNLQSYKLQKKLLNLIGWKVINLRTSEFLQFSINERLSFIAVNLENENKEIKRLGGSQQMILYEK